VAVGLAVIVGLAVAVWLFGGWQWIDIINAVRMVPFGACGCGCGGGKVAVTADVAVAGWQWQWMHSSGDCLAGSGSVVVLRVAVDS
jgi:hypothetical protein